MAGARRSGCFQARSAQAGAAVQRHRYRILLGGRTPLVSEARRPVAIWAGHGAAGGGCRAQPGRRCGSAEAVWSGGVWLCSRPLNPQGSLTTLRVSPSVGLPSRQGSGGSDGRASPTPGPPLLLTRPPWEKQSYLLESHPSAFSELPLPEAQWAEPEVTSRGHSCGLCGPWEHAQARRALPGPQGASPATFVSAS